MREQLRRRTLDADPEKKRYWKHLRTITIPDSLPEGGVKDGVKYASASSGGFWFSFNTDENGDSFSGIKEIFMITDVKRGAGTSVAGFQIKNANTPGYATGAVSTYYGTGTNTTFYHSIGYLKSFGYGWHSFAKRGTGTTGTGAMGGVRDAQTNSASGFSAMSFLIGNATTTGFASGSTFDIWYKKEES